MLLAMLETISCVVQVFLALCLILGITYLLCRGVVFLYRKTSRCIELDLVHDKRLLRWIYSGALMIALTVCAVWGISEIKSDFVFGFNHVGQFVVSVICGCVLIIIICWACIEIGKLARLWLHRRIARMSYGFAVWTCGVVIAAPLVIPVLLFAGMDAAGLLADSGPAIINKAVKGYFYAIFDGGELPSGGESKSPLLIGMNTVSLFFGLVGYLIFSGFTVSVFVEMVRSKKERIEQGEEHYSKLNKHYVIIGSSSLLETLVKSIVGASGAKRPQNIVILASGSIPELRKRLSSNLTEEMMERLIFIHGDRTNKEDLNQLCLDSCSGIYLTGDSSTSDMDDLNLESLTYINAILKGQKAAIKKCKIYLERYHTYSLFQGFIKDTKLDQLDVEPVCFYKHWSEVILGLRPHKNTISYPNMDGEGIGPDSDKYVHLVVIGMSRMGMSLVTESAMHLHFPNSGRKRTRITMIDKNARSEMYKYINLHQTLFSEAYYTYTEHQDAPMGASSPCTYENNADTAWLDTEFHFVQGNVECKEVRRLLESYVQEEANLTIAICLPDARNALSLSLSLPRCLYNRPGVSILVQQEVGAGLLNLLGRQTTKDPHFNNVRPFGMLNEDVGVESDIDKLAPFASMTYIPGCTALYEPDMLLNLARDKQEVAVMRAAWEKMQPWARISNRYAAASRKIKLRSVGLPDAGTCNNITSAIYGPDMNPELFGEMEHNRWCVEKLIVGFRPLTSVEQQQVDSCAPDSPLRAEMLSWFKKEQFAHVGIRPWREVRSNPAYREFYLNSINMGRAICLLPEMKKAADAAPMKETL